jgi:Leucine-rich repeat (LRR) protein
MSSEAVRSLSKLQKLDSLTLHNVAITDDDLTHLASLPKLRELEIDSERLTPACLTTLAKMKSLRVLYVTGKVRIEPAQWTALGEDSLPNCLIARSTTPFATFHVPKANR